MNAGEGEDYAGVDDRNEASPDQDQIHDQPEENEIEYDEMDLTPYEEDDDATLHKKLCAAKVARKRAEEDLKLLCNRIGLLKLEEGKVSDEFQSNLNFQQLVVLPSLQDLTKSIDELDCPLEGTLRSAISHIYRWSRRLTKLGREPIRLFHNVSAI